MTRANPRLTTAVEHYLSDLARQRASGGATGERSTYPPLVNLLNTVGSGLKPKVFCVSELADQGAGHPDVGLYSAKQLQRRRPRPGQIPERGVVEVKPDADDVAEVAAGEQVARYWARYRLVLVTNLREFRLVGPDATRGQTTLEAFRLAETAAEFHRKLEKPRAFAQEVGGRLLEYLARALSYHAALAEPKDLAWLLASYARDGLSRVEAADESTAFESLRAALEEALGIRFEGERGKRFFHSTLVQTLFYGVFSAWVLWARSTPSKQDRFEWKTAVWNLRAPVLRALFQQIADPGRLKPLDLVEVLDWTGAALHRVDRNAFFARFREGEAVPYFYEPFLAAFDPDLRKQLGVWYTPNEIVRYMVARVDRALKDDLGIADGLAAESVYVLDPCCGTGAYLAEVLRRIAANLEERGLGALVGARVKEAATKRVFGFEILPAPFVVAHLQVGLTMQNLDAPFSDSEEERPGVFLTNALTGWGPGSGKRLLFPELEEERDRAERVKREVPILVVLGNPPYNGFAGVAVDEERELLEAYRRPRQVRLDETRALHDLYVRFFRVAERRIAEETGRGIVCFISNHSWLDGMSFAGMRERFLDAFDAIRVDCLNGDKYKTGKVAPDGSPDPSVFSTEEDPVGIQVGTAITTLVRKADHAPATAVRFRHLWGQRKREELLESSEAPSVTLYDRFEPPLPLGLPFTPTEVTEEWFDWPSLPELFPASFFGVLTNRDAFLVDVDPDRLRNRIADYFNPALSHEEIERRYPAAMTATTSIRDRPEEVRAARLSTKAKGGEIVRFLYRPFDLRWLFWERDSGLLVRPGPEYRPQVFSGNMWLGAAQHLRKGHSEAQTPFMRHLGSLHVIERGAKMFPTWIEDEAIGGSKRRPNLSSEAQRYLNRLGLGVEDLFHHALATLHDPGYREANVDGLRLGWPRIPLPGWPDGKTSGAAEELAASAAAGRELAALLDPETPVPGVTEPPFRLELAAISVPSTTDRRQMAGADFEVTAGWGHAGRGGAVMPGTGRAIQRSFASDEQAALTHGNALGKTTFDVWLNQRAFWRNIPATVWNYRLGGYQVLKKWLSYRERSVLKRTLKPEEVQHFTDTARRIAAILLLTTGAAP